MKETPKRLAPTTETLRALFAKSGNQCAFPDCDHPLIDEDNNFVAQVCHIEDALPGGRFNEDMNNEERRSYDNLVLFCYKHHIQTNNLDKFHVSRLKEIKVLHEALFTETFVVKGPTLLNIFNDLKSIKDDTSEIRRTQQTHTEQFEEIKSLLLYSKQVTEIQANESSYIQDIESILKLRETNNHVTALKLLEDFRSNKWEKLNGTEKYKLLANMGICHLDLYNDAKAADFFIAAEKHDPENEKAYSYAALGHSIQGNVEEARKIIAHAIAKNPEDSNAYVALIALEKDNQDFSELLNQIPKKLHDNQEISYAIGGLAKHKNDFQSAINWFQNAVDVAVKNTGDVKAALASTILESLTNPFQVMTGQVDNESRNKISYCIQLLTESWEEFKDSDLRKSRAWILINRGIAKKYLGDFEGAFEDINQSAIITENSYFSLKHLAIAAIETNKLDYSLKLLDQLKTIENEDNKDVMSIDLFRAEVLYKKKEFNQAIDALKVVLKNSSNEKITDNAQSALIFAYMAINDFEEAKKLSTSIIETRPNYLEGYINASIVHNRMNETEEALTILNTAYEQLTDESDHADVQNLAYQFARHKDYIKTIEILERITNPEIYTELSRTLLMTYYNAGETNKALKLCQSIRSGHGPIDIITEIQSAIYETIGDLPNAIEVCEEYLKVYPDDQRVLARLALIYARIKDNTKVKKILERFEILGALPMDILYQLAYLNVSVDELNRGLDIAFETRRKYYYNGEAHLKYIGLISEFRALTEYVGESQKVSIDTAVKLKDEHGDITTYCILDKSEKLSKEELLATDIFAKSLLGSDIGDVIEIERGFGEPQRFEVVNIFSKYIYAFQESIELLNKRFVDVEGFRTFNVGETGDIKKDLKPIFDSLDQTENFDRQVFTFYHQKLFTIGTCAQILGQNPLKFWSIVFGNPDFGIYSISSIHTELQVAYNLLEKGIGIVVDLVSLLSLASIKKLELLEALPNRKIISRSAIELIDELLREYKGISSKGYLTIGKINGEYVKEYISKEQIDTNRIHYEFLLNWAEKNCDVLPCNEALTLNALRKEELDKTFGKAFIDSILLAKEHGYLFLAEEETLRSIALNDFQVKGFPSYALLDYCRIHGFINFGSFIEEIAKLIGLGFKYLPINSEILLKCADMSGYQPAFPFNLAIRTLDSSISSENSSIHVTADFIYKLYASPTLPHMRSNLIVTILSVLVASRNFIVVLQKLIILIELKFKLLQKEKDEVHSIIKEFIVSNNMFNTL